MAEQMGTGRYPKPPKREAWEGTSPMGANDPDQGNFGAAWEEAPGKENYPKVDGGGGAGKDVPKGGSGRTFSTEERTNDLFEQGEIPSTDINYFSFKD